jgi:hypothetical protein
MGCPATQKPAKRKKPEKNWKEGTQQQQIRRRQCHQLKFRSMATFA